MGTSRIGRLDSRTASPDQRETPATRNVTSRSVTGVERLEARMLFAAFTWSGGGGDAGWMNPANWAGGVAPAGGGSDQLVFPAGAARKTNVNDFAAGTDFDQITFTGGGYSISGNAIDLAAAGVSDTSTAGGGNALGVPISISAATTVHDTDDAAALTLGGVISGGGGIMRTGVNGAVVFTAANLYTGGTDLLDGNTYANNASGSAFGPGAVMNTGGTLRGNGGFTGSIAHNAGLAPGAVAATPGILATGSIDFGGSASYGINVNGATAGSGYDRLVATGVVDLGTGRTLNTDGTFAPSGGEKLFIIVNDADDAVIGTFSGLAQGGGLEIGGFDYAISYTGNFDADAATGGNDVVLIAVAPPVNTVPAALATDEDVALVFGGSISVADADSATVSVTVSVPSGAGTLTLPDGALLTGGASGTRTVTLTGSPTDVNSVLVGTSFTPAANSTASVTLTVATTDGVAGDTDTVPVTVSPVNDAPVNTVPGTQTVARNTPLILGLSNGNRITVADVDAGGNDLQVTLTATQGTFTLGGTTGLAFTAGDGAADAAMTFTGSTSAINAALNDSRFDPATDFAGVASLQIVTGDQAFAGAGGPKSDSDTFSIIVPPPGGLDFLPATYAAAEGGGAVTLTVNRTSGTSGEATINYAVTGGTASAGVDFTAVAGTLTFADGETSKTFALPILDDGLDEDDETILLKLANPGGSGVLGVAATTAVVTIADDDPSPTLSIADAVATEGGVASFAVTLSFASGRPVTVDFGTTGGAAVSGSDFTPAAGRLTFAPGETSRSVDVATLADVTQEDAESFTLTLHNALGATITGAGLATGTINNLPNALPVAADDVVVLAAGQANAAIAALANDADGDGDALVVTSVSTPTNGTAVRNDDGTITYTPNAGYSGADSFTYTASDGKGGTATATVSLTVTGNSLVVNPANPKKQDLFFAASPGDDVVQLVRVGRQVRVLVGGQDNGTFAATGNIVISGGAGNDALLVGKIKNPVLFNGGAGDDTLVGGAKSDVLVGGAGNDTLNGGGGRNLIIGGDGADTLTGAGGGDLLIAGPTAYDADTADDRRALNDLLAAWSGGGRYATKIAALAAGVGASGARLAPGVTVFADVNLDTLTGAGGADLFVARTTGAGILDVLTKKARNESVIEL